MPQVKVYNMKAEEVGTLELNDNLFAMDYNESLIHQAVVTRLAKERQGTKSTLTRAEVRGGGIKPFRQKGTGRARQGSSRSPQQVHGGVVFAPKPRDFSKKMNITAKRVALFSALSQKLRDNEIFVIDNITVDAPKTKEMAKFIDAFKFNKSVLMVLAEKDENVLRASANLQQLATMSVELLNTYDVVKNNKIVISKQAIEKIQEAYGE